MKFCMKNAVHPLRAHLNLSHIDRSALAAQAAAMRAQAGEFAHYSVEKAREFSLLDFAFLKVCLLSLGLWLGATCSRFFRRFRVVIFFGFVLSYVYLIWRIFLHDE